jgi:hypothetical protein
MRRGHRPDRRAGALDRIGELLKVAGGLSIVA